MYTVVKKTKNAYAYTHTHTHTHTIHHQREHGDYARYVDNVPTYIRVILLILGPYIYMDYDTTSI